ncbi:MAG: hypothetical protein WAT19_06865 [Ferruginibacter sp.]
MLNEGPPIREGLLFYTKPQQSTPTINPKQSTTNPKPTNPKQSTTNPKPINPKPINPKPINPKPIQPQTINRYFIQSLTLKFWLPAINSSFLAKIC